MYQTKVLTYDFSRKHHETFTHYWMDEQQAKAYILAMKEMSDYTDQIAEFYINGKEV